MVGHVKAIQSGGLVEVWMYQRPAITPKRHRRKKRGVRRVMRSHYAAHQRKLSFERVVRANLDIHGAPITSFSLFQHMTST